MMCFPVGAISLSLMLDRIYSLPLRRYTRQLLTRNTHTALWLSLTPFTITCVYHYSVFSVSRYLQPIVACFSHFLSSNDWQYWSVVRGMRARSTNFESWWDISLALRLALCGLFTCVSCISRLFFTVSVCFYLLWLLQLCLLPFLLINTCFVASRLFPRRRMGERRFAPMVLLASSSLPSSSLTMSLVSSLWRMWDFFAVVWCAVSAGVGCSGVSKLIARMVTDGDVGEALLLPFPLLPRQSGKVHGFSRVTSL